MFSRLQHVRGLLAALVAIAIGIAPFAVAAQPSSAPQVISVSVSGNVHVPTDRILSGVRTKVGAPLDEATLRADLQAIFDLGFFADQVPPLIRQRPGGVSVTFRVVENPVISRIAFTGNEHVPSDTLLALMDTAPGQVLNNDTFHQDVLKINSYYDKIGFAGQVQTHVPNLNITPDGVLQLDIREGLKVKAVLIAGDYLINKQLILNAITLKPGQFYSEDIRDKDGTRIQDLYKNYRPLRSASSKPVSIPARSTKRPAPPTSSTRSTWRGSGPSRSPETMSRKTSSSAASCACAPA